MRVTDRPEWKLRTERVPTSFEAGISDQVISLVDLPPRSNIDWSKEIGLPDTPQKEIDSHLKDVLKSIQNIQDRYYAKRSELKAVPDSNQQTQARNGRFADLCADASLVIDHSLKALIVMSGNKIRRTHDGVELTKLVGYRFRDRCYVAPANVLKKMYVWREASSYSVEWEKLGLSDDELYQTTRRYIQAAMSLSKETLQAYGTVYDYHGSVVNEIREDLSYLREQQSNVDLWYGAPHHLAKETVTEIDTWWQPVMDVVQQIKAGKAPEFACRHVGKRSRKPCVLKKGHRGGHRYS